MTNSFEILQRRFGNDRPGMKLLAIEDAAIPVTVVQTDVLAQERKPLPIIEEFALRFVHAGVQNPPDIAALLGLEPEQVFESAAIQVSENNLVRRSTEGGLAVSAQGLEVVRNLAATQPVLKRLPVVFDRLTWRLVDYPRSTLLTKKDAQERGLTLLPASQNARIGTADVTASGFNALLAIRDGKERRIEILRVRKVSPNTHRYLPVQLLVYGDPTRQELDLAVCVDGDLSPDHGLALDAIKAVERLGLAMGAPEPRPVLDEALESKRVSAEELDSIASKQGPESNSSEEDEAEIAVSAVRHVSVFEHASLLSKALDESQTRLLIISPWIRKAVVNTDFLARLERRLRAGVVVTIAHGYGVDDSGSDDQALQRLTNLAGRYSEFTFVRLKNSHAKILISDGAWVTTSFNWLSFRGDAERTYRMEEGTMVTIAANVDEAYSRYLALIDDQRA